MKQSWFTILGVFCLAGTLLADDNGRPGPPQGVNDILGALNGPDGAKPRGPTALRAHLLTHFDVDQNGELSPREREAAIIALRDRKLHEAQGKPSKLTEREVVHMFDADGNGGLDVKELTVARGALNQILGEGADRRIAGQQQGRRDGQGGAGQGGPQFRGKGRRPGPPRKGQGFRRNIGENGQGQGQGFFGGFGQGQGQGQGGFGQGGFPGKPQGGKPGGK